MNDKNKTDINEIEECNHEWCANGITKRDYYSRYSKKGEIVFASCICKKCGEIRIKKEDKNL